MVRKGSKRATFFFALHYFTDSFLAQFQFYNPIPVFISLLYNNDNIHRK